MHHHSGDSCEDFQICEAKTPPKNWIFTELGLAWCDDVVGEWRWACPFNFRKVWGHADSQNSHGGPHVACRTDRQKDWISKVIQPRKTDLFGDRHFNMDDMLAWPRYCCPKWDLSCLSYSKSTNALIFREIDLRGHDVEKSMLFSLADLPSGTVAIQTASWGLPNHFWQHPQPPRTLLRHSV